MSLLCYRCPLEELCKWAQKETVVKTFPEYVFIHDEKERLDNCPLLKLLKPS